MRNKFIFLLFNFMRHLVHRLIQPAAFNANVCHRDAVRRLGLARPFHVLHASGAVASHTNRCAIRWYGAAHMSRAQAEERVISVLKKFDKVDMKKLELGTPFTQLGLDSLDVVEVMISLEDEFHIEIPDAVADKVQTPKEIAQYIYGFLNPQKPEQPDHYSEDSSKH